MENLRVWLIVASVGETNLDWFVTAASPREAVRLWSKIPMVEWELYI